MITNKTKTKFPNPALYFAGSGSTPPSPRQSRVQEVGVAGGVAAGEGSFK